MVALLTDSFGLKSSKLAQLDSTKFDEEPFCARNNRDCHREEGQLASGSITAATLTVNVAFLQITAHAPKMQIPNNQIINFYQRAR